MLDTLQQKINIIDLNSNLDNETYNSTAFGWPLFEGENFLREQPFKNSDQLIPDNSKNNIDLYYWNEGVANSAFEYFVKNSVEPSLFYYHSGDDPFSFRAAIIGGDILESEKYGTSMSLQIIFQKKFFMILKIINWIYL